MRPDDQLRPVEIQLGYLAHHPANVLYRSGDTIVLCTASLEPSVPPWMAGKGKGWVTAEYNMLPGSTRPRKPRDRGAKIDGRTTEIQRLIARSLRAVADLQALGEVKGVGDKTLEKNAERLAFDAPQQQDKGAAATVTAAKK